MQSSIVIPNESGAAARAGINDAYESITTLFSGSSAPSTTYPFMWWEDTGTGTLKQRDSTDSSWIAKSLAGAADSPYFGFQKLSRPANYQTGTSYTLVVADAGSMVDLANASSIVLTVPPHSGAAFSAEDEIDLFQSGAGQVTVTAGAGVTIHSYGSDIKIAGQYGAATLKQTATPDTWRLVGNLS